MIVDELVYHINSIANLLGLDLVTLCITLQEQFTDPDDEDEEEQETYNALDQAYEELVKQQEF